MVPNFWTRHAQRLYARLTSPQTSPVFTMLLLELSFYYLSISIFSSRCSSFVYMTFSFIFNYCRPPRLWFQEALVMGVLLVPLSSNRNKLIKLEKAFWKEQIIPIIGQTMSFHPGIFINFYHFFAIFVNIWSWHLLVFPQVVLFGSNYIICFWQGQIFCC